MSDSIEKLLQALFHSGDITSFVSARVPDGKLASGWIGQSLLQKGFTGKIEDKTNQEQLVIPLDRFVRLHNDLNTDTRSNLGFCIIGERGLAKPRFTAVVTSDNKSKSNQLLAVAIRSDKYGLRNLTHNLIQSVTQVQDEQDRLEPNLDYIEQLKIDTSVGIVVQLVSVKLTTTNEKMAEFIERALKEKSKNGDIVAQYGELKDISSNIILLTRWLLGLELFQKLRQGVAAIILTNQSRIQFFLWDSPQKLATFAVVRSENIKQVFDKYILPIWITSDDLSKSDAKTPLVTIRAEKTQSQITSTSDISHETDITKLSINLDKTVRLLQERLSYLEKKIGEFDSSSLIENNSDDKSLDILQSRLSETIDKLESLATKLNSLEKRIEKITK